MRLARYIGSLACAKAACCELCVDDSVPLHIRGYGAGLHRIVSNLAHNAVKFTDEGTVCITVSSKPEGESRAQLRITVSDTGPGIPEEKHSEIFRPFCQLEGTEKGAAVGLYLADKYARVMGGSLRVRSFPGKGTIFVAKLPVEVDLSQGDDNGAAGELFQGALFNESAMPRFGEEISRHRPQKT